MKLTIQKNGFKISGHWPGQQQLEQLSRLRLKYIFIRLWDQGLNVDKIRSVTTTQIRALITQID